MGPTIRTTYMQICTRTLAPANPHGHAHSISPPYRIPRTRPGRPPKRSPVGDMSSTSDSPPVMNNDSRVGSPFAGLPTPMGPNEPGFGAGAGSPLNPLAGNAATNQPQTDSTPATTTTTIAPITTTAMNPNAPASQTAAVPSSDQLYPSSNLLNDGKCLQARRD